MSILFMSEASSPRFSGLRHSGLCFVEAKSLRKKFAIKLEKGEFALTQWGKQLRRVLVVGYVFLMTVGSTFN